MFRCLALSLLWLSCGCAVVRSGREPLAEMKSSSVVRGQLILHPDFELPREHPLLAELLALQGEIAAQLAIPTTEEPIHVYLYESAEAYHVQAAPYFHSGDTRRAFFLERESRLNVYAQWGDSAAIDLRHELTHGYLHASVRNLPLWLDEGLAEYFEVAPNLRGVNQPHLALLAEQAQNGSWSPDLVRLESLASAGDMTQLDYAEAWLWTHWLLTATPRHLEALQSTVKQLRLSGGGEPLSKRIEKLSSWPHRSVLEHLRQELGEMTNRE